MNKNKLKTSCGLAHPCDEKEGTNLLSLFLFRQIDASTLATFRILFGSILFWETFRYVYYSRIENYFISPTFFFTYPLFDFVKPLPSEWMYLPFVMMGVTSAFIALGLYYRVATIAFFLTYTYIFLIDSTQYNNHYYFICLIGVLLSVVRGNACFSLDGILNSRIKSDFVPYWNVFILKFQVFVVYFFGGIAKLNWDWLRGEPLRNWLDPEEFPTIDGWLDFELWVYFLSYGGLLFDLLIGFGLLYKRTRVFSILLVFIFNLANDSLFSIGIFPFLMLGATVLFLDPETPRNLLKFLRERDIQFGKEFKPPEPSTSTKPVILFLIIYCAFQILMPFRHWLYPGNVSWTEEGHRWAWHMKLRSKRGYISFVVKNPETGEEKQVNMEGDLTTKQFIKMAGKPDMIIQYAHLIRDRLIEKGVKNPVVYAKTSASLNYRSVKTLIDPSVNLAEVEYSPWHHNEWILIYEWD